MEFNATFLVSLISFLMFVIIMNKVLYEPVTSIVEKRETLIFDNQEHAKINLEKANELLSDRDKKLRQAVKNSKELSGQKLADANETAKQQTTEAKKQALSKVNAEKNNLLTKSEQLSKDVVNNLDDIVNKISSKVLGEI